jgi:membrane-associated protease RseP (regulator of RpoE activity)
MTLLSDSFRSRSDSSVVTDFEHQVVGIAQYAGFGRAYVFPFEYIRDTVVKRVVQKQGDVPAGWLGILGDSVSKLPDGDVSPLGLAEKRGVIVREIITNGPAAEFGLLENDVIVGIDSYDVAGAADLGLLLSFYTAGTKVRLRGIRNRQPVDLTVVLGARDVQTQAVQSQPRWALERSAAAEAAEARARLSELQGLYRSYLKSAPSAERNQALTELGIEMRFLYDGLRELGSQTVASTATPPPPPARAIGQIRGGDFSGEPEASAETRALVPLGFWARELTPQLARELVVAGGMLVDSVVKESAADKAGLKVGDVIVSVAGRQLFKASQLLAAATAPGPQVELRVVRNRQALTLVIPRP